MLPAGAICSMTAAHAICATTWKPLHGHYNMYDLRQRRHRPSTHPSPPPTGSRMHRTRRCHSSPPTLPPLPPRAPRLSSAVYRSRRLKHAPAVLHGTAFTTSSVCSARHCCFPSPAPPVSPPRAPSASPASKTLPVHARASAHLQPDTGHPRRAEHIPSPAPRRSPPRRLQRLTTLRSKPAAIRHRECYMEQHGSTQPVPRSLTVSHAAHIASSTPTPAFARNFDLPRTSQIAPPCG
ncbi:hypothetical protein DFH08DRAFT_429766 [Mycena albidolilacea]|uniref:Uncharacterized protein n=1 Tax=Mycena albidolilacea TaxID=1033008 RepID=A0AAD6ZA42_9AGAR|nr:hypothetical protein DFH08DRAFT_429766 [Mycena albidolilacea]